jgi:hypothetical protein
MQSDADAHETDANRVRAGAAVNVHETPSKVSNP